jgi:septin family protein
MRRLHQKVNLIPVIAKADTLTDEEVTEFKQRVCQVLNPRVKYESKGFLGSC